MLVPSIRVQWNESEGSQLRQELEDAAKRMPGLSPEMQQRFAFHLASSARKTRATFGPFPGISAKQKLEIAKQLRKRGRESFANDVSQGYACFILGALYEADTLPGDDAKFVRSMCAEFVIAATQVERTCNEADHAVRPAAF